MGQAGKAHWTPGPIGAVTSAAKPNDLPQPQPPGNQAPTKPGSSESPLAEENKRGRRQSAAGSGLGVGTVPKAPRRQCFADCELATLAHNTDPQNPIPKGSSANKRQQPTRRAYPNNNGRKASAQPYHSKQPTDDADGTWRLTVRNHVLPVPNRRISLGLDLNGRNHGFGGAALQGQSHRAADLIV